MGRSDKHRSFGRRGREGRSPRHKVRVFGVGHGPRASEAGEGERRNDTEGFGAFRSLVRIRS